MSLNRFCRHGLWNLAASTAGIALAALAFAGDRDPRGPEFPISVAEARERAEARFAEIDSDGNEQISRAEFDAAPMPHHTPGRRDMRAAGRDMMREHMFMALDTDGDGSLSRDDLPDMAGRLAQMDDDGDGLVTRAEARAHHRAKGDDRRADGTDTGQ